MPMLRSTAGTWSAGDTELLLWMQNTEDDLRALPVQSGPPRTEAESTARPAFTTTRGQGQLSRRARPPWGQRPGTLQSAGGLAMLGAARVPL